MSRNGQGAREAAAVGRWRAGGGQWALGAGYVAAYVLLELVTAPHGAPELAAWHPPQALALALLMVAGFRHVPTVFVAALLAALATNREVPLPVQVATAAVEAAGYGLAARVLRDEVDFDPRLSRLRDVLAFVVVAVTAAMAVTATSVLLRAGAGSIPWSSYTLVTFRDWASEAVTFLSLTPALLLHQRSLREPRRWLALVRPESLMVAAAIGCIVWLLFGHMGAEAFKGFYLVFLPLIWVSVRHGLPGASLGLALTQAALHLASSQVSSRIVTIPDLQILMIALAVTTLVLAAVVSERRRADGWLRAHQAELAHASRLSATGEMASALAHQLNQPLAATVSYVRACQVAMERNGSAEPALGEMMDKAVAQAERASQVVRGLRAFLRKGDAPRVAAQMRVLVSEALALASAEATRHGVAVRTHVPDRLPPVRVDVIQIEQVILNLVRNGVDAVAGAAVDGSEVTVSAARRGAELEVAVSDTGPGLSHEVAGRLFTPFTTTKPSGMGLGLVIARSIVEAHGGRLWAEPRSPRGTTFRFTLPIAEDEAHVG